MTDLYLKLQSSRSTAKHATNSDTNISQESTPQQISSAMTNNGDMAKKRSLLPQRGQVKVGVHRSKLEAAGANQKERNIATVDASRSAVTRHDPSLRRDSLQSSKEVRLRPRSMYQTSVTSIEQHSEREQSVRPTSVFKVPQLPGLTRSSSLRKPGVPTPSDTSSRTHSRTQSTSIVVSSRSDGPSDSQISQRPKSLLAASGDTMKGAGYVPTGSASNSSTRLVGLKRSASVKSDVEVTVDSGMSAMATKTDSQRTITSAVNRHEYSREEAKKLGRPAFSTLQQHFTPKKVGKAPTSTFLHPTILDVGMDSLPRELACIQSELLQLHLLHQSSARVSRQWELSAKKALDIKFGDVASRHLVLRETERQGQEQKNLQVLHDWHSGNCSLGLVEQIQILSGPLHELPSLLDYGGRFRRLTDDFGRWLQWVEDIWAARDIDTGRQTEVLDTVESLGDAWKSENDLLTRKLTAFSRDMDKLNQPSTSSTISTIVATCKELLRVILEELYIMNAIEVGVVIREKEWIETSLKAIALDIGAHLATSGTGEIWLQ
jgi:hypothetical protein